MISTTSSQNTIEAKTVFSMPRLLLHAEGLALFILATGLYAHFVGDWLLFVVLLLAPDLAMIGYVANKKIGAMTYNALHTTLAPIALGAVSIVLGWQFGFALALILAAHIGMDRTVGYGLKYAKDFKSTHLNVV